MAIRPKTIICSVYTLHTYTLLYDFVDTTRRDAARRGGGGVDLYAPQQTELFYSNLNFSNLEEKFKMRRFRT